MDRMPASQMALEDGDDAEVVALPSRASALSACRVALGRGGPILLTGAAGVGKTWLLRRLVDASPLTWIRVEIAPDMAPIDLIAAVASALGAPTRGRSASEVRAAMVEALALSRADDRRIGLALDEAHLATDDVLEEMRLLTNRLPDPLAAMVISGQTALSRRVDAPSHLGLESRLAARVHLLPLDAEEASSLLAIHLPHSAEGRDRVESWHRDSGGIPGRLLRLAERAPAIAPDRRPIEPRELHPDPADERPSMTIAVPSPRSEESLVPDKPPLRVEDGLIEVGWDSADESAEPASTPGLDDRHDHQPIDDHYAALQAWDEWARNQGRWTPRREPDLEEIDDPDEIESEAEPAMARWSEPAQSFGPYSQLFSRMTPLKGVE